MVSRLTLFIMALLYCASPILGQHQHNHSSQAPCGTGIADQEIIKDRLMENRRNKTNLLAEYSAFKQRRAAGDTTFWIPVVFHMASRADGSGQHKDDWVLQQMCYFNENFADQNMKFYLLKINRFASDQIYVNSQNADYVRSIHRVDEAMNIYVGGPTDPSSGYGAYYAPNFDWIFTWNDIYSWGLSHEVGHFLTLPHTFNGWEGTDYATASSGLGHAPEMGTNGKPVETVDRSGALENCQWAADGFCDTPPDYSSGGGGCTSPISWNDPNNNTFNLDQSIRLNYMSYFFCGPKVFTTQQKEAMLLDNLSRGYHYNDVPYPLEVVDGSAPSLTWPSDNSIAPYTNSAVHFQWNKVDSAGMYLITVDRTFNGTVVSNSYKKVVYTNEAWLNLNPNQEYSWHVEALTRSDLCGSAQNVSSTHTFTTADWTVNTQNIELPIESSRVFPNPSAGANEVILELNVPMAIDAEISIYNSLGQNVLPAQTLTLQPGANLEQINVEALAAGMYIINIETATERISHKLMIQK
jgi:hypothetical protein